MTNSIAGVAFVSEKPKPQNDNTTAASDIKQKNILVFAPTDVKKSEKAAANKTNEISLLKIPEQPSETSSLWENFKKTVKGAASGIKKVFGAVFEIPIIGVSAVALTIAAAAGSHTMLGITLAALLGVILGAAFSGISYAFSSKPNSNK